MRHAEAEDLSDSGTDDTRPLTVRGRRRTSAAARGLRALKLGFDAIFTSPLLRATETADIIAAEYSKNPFPQVLPALSTGVSPHDLIRALEPHSDHKSVLVVGHEPQLSHAISILLSANENVAIRLKKGACVALEIPGKVEPGRAVLRWMLTQGQLRKLRKG
jgi:phosphohistidine phosphatase